MSDIRDNREALLKAVEDLQRRVKALEDKGDRQRPKRRPSAKR